MRVRLGLRIKTQNVQRRKLGNCSVSKLCPTGMKVEFDLQNPQGKKKTIQNLESGVLPVYSGISILYVCI